MNLTGRLIIWLAFIADYVGAFIPPLQTSSSQQVYFEVVGGLKIRPMTAVPVQTSARPAFSRILRATEEEEEVTVFDAGGSVSWADYKKQKPEEYKVGELLHDTQLYKFPSSRFRPAGYKPNTCVWATTPAQSDFLVCRLPDRCHVLRVYSIDIDTLSAL